MPVQDISENLRKKNEAMAQMKIALIKDTMGKFTDADAQIEYVKKLIDYIFKDI